MKTIFIKEKDIKNMGLLINDLSPMDVINYNQDTACLAVSYNDEDRFDETVEKLNKLNIPNFSENPVVSADFFKKLSTDKKTNIVVSDVLDNETYDFVQNIIAECFDKNGEKHNFTVNEKIYLAKRVLEETLNVLDKETEGKVRFPYVNENY